LGLVRRSQLIALCCGKVQPHVSGDVICRNASTIGVHEPEASLGARVSLLSSEAIPADGFHVVLWNTSPIFVHDPKDGLGNRVPLLSQRLQLTKCSRIVATFVGRKAFVEILRGSQGRD
jgi:hypothetical protein